MQLGTLARATGAAFFVFGTLALLTGCGGGGGGRTAKVSGAVTFDGKPLEQGKITFRGTGKDAQVTSGDIKAGRYECTAAVGKPTVEIDAYTVVAADTTGVGQRNYIPEKYNANSELTADVTADGANEFNFKLLSK